MTPPAGTLHAAEPEAAQIARLRQALAAEPGLEFAVLIGSRATGQATADSDWDIAVQWPHELDWLEQLGRSESLRRRLGTLLAVTETAIDLTDVPRASLAMRAAIAEEGIVLQGEDDLPWQRFLRRTWRELEDYDWEQAHAQPGLCHAETTRIAAEQGGLLDEARARILAAQRLNALEQNGRLHALQVLIENAIGKAKQLIKAKGQPVPISVYDTFAALSRLGLIAENDLPAWNAIIGLRNRIVHDYMNVDMDRVLGLIGARQYAFVLDFLLAPMDGDA